MVTQNSTGHVSISFLRLIAVAVVGGLVVGALISVAAFYLARYGPSGDSWSFRGNGALVAYGLLPAVLTAGWTAMVLHRRSSPAWLGVALGAGLISLLLLAIDAALLPLFGIGADRVIGRILIYALLAWAVLAPILASRIGIGRHEISQPANAYLAAGVLWPITLLIGLLGVGMMIPAGS
jgi:hypothetical protein